MSSRNALFATLAVIALGARLGSSAEAALGEYDQVTKIATSNDLDQLRIQLRDPRSAPAAMSRILELQQGVAPVVIAQGNTGLCLYRPGDPRARQDPNCPPLPFFSDPTANTGGSDSTGGSSGGGGRWPPRVQRMTTRRWRQGAGCPVFLR